MEKMEMTINGQLIPLEEVISKTIKAQGNSGMVIVPKKYIGQEAVVCVLPEEKYGDYEIRRDGFVQTISVDWQDETVTYYHHNSGVWLHNIEQVKTGWSYQNNITQEEYEKFLSDISEDGQLLELIAHLEIGESVPSLNNYEITRVA